MCSSKVCYVCFQASRKVSKCGYLFVAPGYDFSNPLDKTRVGLSEFFLRWISLTSAGV